MIVFWYVAMGFAYRYSSATVIEIDSICTILDCAVGSYLKKLGANDLAK